MALGNQRSVDAELEVRLMCDRLVLVFFNVIVIPSDDDEADAKEQIPLPVEDVAAPHPNPNFNPVRTSYLSLGMGMVRTYLLQPKGLFNHTSVGEGRPGVGAEHSIFAEDGSGSEYHGTLQPKGLFNHTTVYISASMIMLSTVMVEIFAYMVGAEEVNGVDAPTVSIQQQSLSSLAYYSLTGQRKDFPVVLF
ncbi:hypothetical protein Tco_1128373 [Tanacetum coccineum]